MTTTGVLFRKAEMKAMTGNTRRFVLATVDFFCGNMAKIKRSNTPLLRIPSLTRNKRATVIMPLFEKPSNTSLGVSIPAQKNKMTTEKVSCPDASYLLSKPLPFLIGIIVQIQFQMSYKHYLGSLFGSTINHGFNKSSLLYRRGSSFPA